MGAVHGFSVTRILVVMWLLCAGVDASAADLIAHRANADGEIENSLAAIQAAWAAGADGVEIDVRVSADGVIYLFHDDEIEDRPVPSLSYVEMQRIAGVAAVPRLSDVLSLAGSPGYYLLDLKDMDTDGARRVTDLVKSTDFAAVHIAFQSDQLEILEAIGRGLPDSRFYFLSKLKWRFGVFRRPKAVELVATLRGRHLNGVSVKGRRYIDRDFVETLQSNGLSVNIWTINESQRIGFYQSIGVDAIITDAAEHFSGKTWR